ncbi:hypothetical protein HZB89_00605 [archaeon]|nr:hypothetical protein [archaeon]
MQLMIEVKTIKEQWQPPFKKETIAENLVVEEGGYFLQIPGQKDFVFRLIRLNNNSALVEFHNLFMPKNEERPGSRQMLINFGEEKAFTAQWSSNGVAYSIKPLKAVSVEAPEKKEIIEAREDSPEIQENRILEQLK